MPAPQEPSRNSALALDSYGPVFPAETLQGLTWRDAKGATAPPPGPGDPVRAVYYRPRLSAFPERRAYPAGTFSAP